MTITTCELCGRGFWIGIQSQSIFFKFGEGAYGLAIVKEGVSIPDLPRVDVCAACSMRTLSTFLSPDIVEVLIRKDKKVIWINVNGVCKFRACKIKELIVNHEG